MTVEVADTQTGEYSSGAGGAVVVQPDGTAAAATFRYNENRAYVAKMKGVELSGADGVITMARKKGVCAARLTCLHFTA